MASSPEGVLEPAFFFPLSSSFEAAGAVVAPTSTCTSVELIVSFYDTRGHGFIMFWRAALHAPKDVARSQHVRSDKTIVASGQYLLVMA